MWPFSWGRYFFEIMADRNHDAAADFMSRPGRKPATPVAAATASSPLSAQQQRLDAQLAIGQGGPQVAGAVASLQYESEHSGCG